MRLCGIETEYGLAIEGRGPKTQLEDAALLVKQCQVKSFDTWDYGCETPRNDIRGFEAKALAIDPRDAEWDEGQATRHERDVRADRILVNGARFYNDHGHPEYATPECNRLLDLVAHDAAGELVVQQSAEALSKQLGLPVAIYKNNTDFHGASYGTHENYRVERTLGFEHLLSGLLPWFVCRQVLTGPGKVGSEVGRSARFQLSQRADFLSELASVDTLYRRPLFNTRDEPHDDSGKWLRLHVINGDSNRMQWATAMKAGMTSIVLDLIHEEESPQWHLCAPVKAFESISKDERKEWRIELANGSWTTAIEVLDAYVSAGERVFAGRDAETSYVLTQMRLAIDDLRVDPMRLRDRVDWAAKLWMLEKFAEADGWEPETMRSLDLQYHLVNPEESLFDAYRQTETVVELVSPARIEDSVRLAPPTRAAKRGAAVDNPTGLKALGWRRAVYDDNGTSRVVLWDSDSDEHPS